MAPGTQLTIGHVSKILELPVYTVRRMCDQGMIGVTLTPGKHRRITVKETMRMRRWVRKYRKWGLTIR